MASAAPLAHPVEQVEVALEVGGGVLRAVAKGRVFRPFYLAGGSGNLTHQAAQKRGFT